MAQTRRFRLGVFALVAVLAVGVAGCATPPANPRNACTMLKEKSGWYRDTQRAYKRWGVPIQVQLAIIYQESRFRHDAKPPRGRLLWVIPWGRVSSAYGYAQIQDGTWRWYQRATGHHGADRDDFADVTDFIGWYVAMVHRTLGISKWDAYRQYLAYHEGPGGYRRRTYLKKPWLMRVARKVAANARRYRAQIARCRSDLESGPWWWPF